MSNALGFLSIVREKRKEKGYSQEYMANELNISQPAYTQLESGATKLSLERAIKLTQILEIPISVLEEVFMSTMSVHNNEFKDNSSVIHNYHATPSEMYESKIKHLESEILYLREMLENALKK